MDYESNEFITMRFPKGNKIFERFNNKSFEEQESIIKLGITMMETGKDRKITLNSEEWSSKLDKIKKKTDKERQELKSDLHELKEKFEEYKEKRREEIASAIKEERIKVETRCNSSINDSNNKCKLLSLEIENLKKEKWDMAEKLRIQYDEKIEKIRENTLHYQEKREQQYKSTMDNLADRLQNAIKDDEKYKVASNKGKEGESNVQQYLVMSLPKCNVVDVSQDGGCGDIILQDISQNVMVEVKNYNSANVKTSEVNKFKKDILNNKNMAGGIFISLFRGICLIDDWTFDTIDGRPVVYLCNVANDMNKIITAYKIIKKISQLNIDWSVEEKMTLMKAYTKKFVSAKKKKLKLIDKHAQDMVKIIEQDEAEFYKFLEILKS
jgi:hypothetical protein